MKSDRCNPLAPIRLETGASCASPAAAWRPPATTLCCAGPPAGCGRRARCRGWCGRGAGCGSLWHSALRFR